MRTLLSVALVASGCASGMDYKYYVLGDLPSYEGKLLGPKEKDDLPLSVCKPDDVNKGKCIVIRLTEFERILTDAKRMQVRLKACEQD